MASTIEVLPFNRPFLSVNGPLAMVAAAYLATVPLLIGWFMPFVVAGFAATMGFTEQQSGMLVSADMLGYTVGTFLASPLLAKVDWRRACALLLVFVIVTNLISCNIAGIAGLLAIRLCAGLASGALAAIALGACAQGDDPGSAYGLWQTFQAIAAAAAGLTLPALIEGWTTRVAFVLIAIAAAMGLPLVRFIPSKAIQRVEAAKEAVRIESGVVRIAMAVVALFLFLGATTAITAFLERIGLGMAIAPQTIGYALSAAGVSSLAGGLLATKMGDRLGYLGPTVAGAVLAALAYIAYVVAPPGVPTLVFGTVLYFGAYSFVAAYYMGTLAVADVSGRAVAVGNGALGAGVTLGPLLGGWILKGASSAAVLCYVAAGMTLVSVALILPLQARIRSAARSAKARENKSRPRTR